MARRLYFRPVFVLNRLWPVAGALLLTLPTCGPPTERPDCFKATGHTAREHRALPPFSVLQVYDNVRVVLAVDGQPFGADLEAGRNLLSEINTDIRPTAQPGRFKLVISNANRCNFVRDQTRPITVTVHLPDSAARRAFQVLHNGEELVRTAQAGTRLDSAFLLTINTGDLDFDLQSTYVWTKSYEYGDLRLRGTTRELHSEASGTGHLLAENLVCETAYVSSYREGEVRARATAGLWLTLHGNANGYWYGHPAHTDYHAYGKGQVVRGGD